MRANEDRAPYGVLAALQILGGVAILAFGAFGAPPNEKPADFMAGPAAILLGVVSATVLPRMGTWALHTTLVASALLVGFLSVLSETGQAQMGAGFGFVVVAMLAGTLLDRRALAAFLVLLLAVLGVSYAMNPVISNPLYLGVIAVVSVMVAISIAVVVARARSAMNQYRSIAERLDAVWNSQLDPFLLLAPEHAPDGAVEDLHILEANDAARDLFGRSEAIEGISLRAIVPQEFSGDVIARLAHCLDTGDPVILDGHPLTPDPRDGPRLYDIRAFCADGALALTWQDVTERAAAQQDLEKRARYDGLTGCLSRSEGLRRLQRALRGRRSAELRPIALFCDLDNFKDINDSYGHAAGDQVLRATAARISDCVRDEDLVIRAGGDEFVVVLTGVETVRIGLDIAEKIRSTTAEPIRLPEGDLSVTTSIGLARAEPGQSVDDLLAIADRAMYVAKQSGRNRVAAAGPELVPKS